MAVLKRRCGEFHCLKYSSCSRRTERNGWSIKSSWDFMKTQLCTIAVSLTLFSSVNLPKEAFKHGAVPYLVVYTFWLLVVGLPIALLQLALGQLSQQDPVGLWRAVPIMRGVGHLKLLTSYVCCVYYMVYIALSTAYLIWIGKGTFPLKDCTKLHITPNGYENRMNATECFNSTFLSAFTEHPQYIGIMTVLIFFLWFFVPILLYRLRKTLKVSLSLLAPVIILMAVILCIFLGKKTLLKPMFESCEKWTPLYQPNIWYSALVQTLLTTQIFGGYLISAGGTVYRHSDVRWTSAFLIMTNIFSGWLWVLLWEAIGGETARDSSFISILVLIYQSSITERRTKEWPLLALALVFVSGIISVLTLLFPVYDKLHRLAGDHWRLFATISSAAGTALTVAVLSRGLEVIALLDEIIVPVLAVFTSAVEVIGIVFIYGWCNLAVDIEFLTGTKLPCFWVGTWWTTPIFITGVTGWWLRTLIKMKWGQLHSMWSLSVTFGTILFVMLLIAAIAVTKEEQYNLLSKISSAFKPSRLWGPEEPLARYVWMSQRYHNEVLSSNNDSSPEPKQYPAIYNIDIDKKYDEWNNDAYGRNFNIYSKNDFINNDLGFDRNIIPHSIPRGKKKDCEEKFRSPNICIAKSQLGGPLNCNCNRHFTLNVPTLNYETTTSL